MSRRKVVKSTPRNEEIDVAEMFGLYDEPSDEAMMGIMSSVISASNSQIISGIELTKVIVSKSSADMNVDEVLDIFTKAMLAISENSKMKGLLDKFMSESEIMEVN